MEGKVKKEYSLKCERKELTALQEAIIHARKVADDEYMRASQCTAEDIMCDKWSNCIDCATDHEDLANWLDELLARRNKEEKYKWHNLRKNPEDLPKSETRVIFYTTELEDVNNEHRYWTGEYYNKIFYNDDYEGYVTIHRYYICDVIAWKYIESFQEEGDS